MKEDIRCSVIGNAGGGKSTFSRSLAKTFSLPLYELDNILWQGDWQAVPTAQFVRKHNEIIRNSFWVVDGFGLMDSLQDRIERSTHIVLIDLPIWLHFSMAAERLHFWKMGELENPPGGMTHPPQTKRLFELMWNVHTNLMPRVREMVERAQLSGVNTVAIDSIDRLTELQRNPEKITTEK